MLRKIRIAMATVFFAGITLLFLDFTGTVHRWLGWMARVQFLPALMALNVAVVVALVVLTLVFGRVYCSVVCPLGVMQDIFGWAGRRGKKRRNRYGYSPAKTWLRVTMLVVFVASLLVGVGSAFAMLAQILAPYSAYGRIAQNLLQPLWLWGNNALAYAAERAHNYAFYSKEVWLRSLTTFLVAGATLLALGILAWRNGRTYCNTVCPVGTVLGFLARYSWLKPVINTEKCNACGLCGRRCKAACINSKEHTIDYSRCVACMDCISNCKHGAISYSHPKSSEKAPAEVDQSRRAMLAGVALAAGAAVIHAKGKKVDGGLAVILDKKRPARTVPIVPPGAVSLRHLTDHCTACQLCVAVCPNNVLRPSGELDRLMQPESSYERGFCRPECVRCSEVCPAGAIRPITVAEKSAIQIGRAVWVKENCIVLTDDVPCGNCARHCPAGAIAMVPIDPSDPESLRIPSVDTERCIGCGACEYVCPARPFRAIYVDGNEVHRTI